MSIREHLNKIRNAIYGREIREAIAKGIEETYNDASEKHNNANMEVKLARGPHPNLNNRLDEMEETDQEVTEKLTHIENSKADKSQIGAPTQSQVDDWLERNPEATSTVQDNSITSQKIKDGTITTKDLKRPIVRLHNIDTFLIDFTMNKITQLSPSWYIDMDGTLVPQQSHPSLTLPEGLMEGNDWNLYALYLNESGELKLDYMNIIPYESLVLTRMIRKRVLDNKVSFKVVGGAEEDTGEDSEEDTEVEEDTGENTGAEENYDWSTNKFVFPNKLYLVKDVEYGINATNFNYNKFRTNNDMTFEIAGVTKSDVSKDTIDLFSPMALELNTYVSGIYRNNPNDVIHRDLQVDFADPQSKNDKEPTVLYIGDSLTTSNIPPLSKKWLNHFGFQPRFIGTATNGHDDWGFPANAGTENGEGRHSWRLSDYAGTSELTDGTPYINPENPFINPETNRFDFTYYMENNGFDSVDFIVIMLGTNDITGADRTGVGLKKYSIDEILDKMPGEFQLMIDSIHEFDPEIKIGLNPPLQSNELGYSKSATRFTETMIDNFDKGQDNVFVLGSYLGTGKLSGKSLGQGVEKTPVDSTNDSYRRALSQNVHDGGPNQYINALWSVSWIVNQSE